MHEINCQSASRMTTCSGRRHMYKVGTLPRGCCRFSLLLAPHFGLLLHRSAPNKTKDMFRNLSSQLATTGKEQDKKSMSPTLRSDIYATIDQAKVWIAGERGQAGDGMSYGALLSTIQKHFPETKIGLDAIGRVEGEVAVIVGGITSMVLEFSKWDSMSGGLAVRTWVEAVVGAYGRIGNGTRKEMVAKGITRGINYNADVGLMTKEFTARIQIISCLKEGECRVGHLFSEPDFLLF